MTDLTLFRVYEPRELRDGRYPRLWHGGVDGDDGYGIKDLVRDEAGHRCVRCGHPYRVGESGEWDEGDPTLADDASEPLVATLDADGWEDLRVGVNERQHVGRVLWSDCDARCTHGGPVRWWDDDFGDWHLVDEPPERRGYFKRQQAAWRILTVHHLNERKEDCRWHNLVALCQRCHLNVQRRVKMDRPWPWSHSEWFRPYVAAHYAVKYGANPAPTREWAVEHMAEMLALGGREEAVERMPV